MAKVNNMICAAAPGDVFLIIELKKRLARIGIRRPNSQLGPALRLTTGRDNFYSNNGSRRIFYSGLWVTDNFHPRGVWAWTQRFGVALLSMS